MGVWWKPLPGRFTPEKTRYALYKRLGGPQGQSGRVLYRLSYRGPCSFFAKLIIYVTFQSNKILHIFCNLLNMHSYILIQFVEQNEIFIRVVLPLFTIMFSFQQKWGKRNWIEIYRREGLNYIFFWERERGHPVVYYQICTIYYAPSIHNTHQTRCNSYN